MDLGLKEKVAIITGSSRGLGRAFALGLAGEGCHITLCARGEEKLRETEKEVKAKGVNVLALVADVTKPEDCERIVQSTVDAFGRIDVLINNAGGGRPGDDDAAWYAFFEGHMLSAARMTRLVVPHMRGNGGGSIINISSIWGREAGGGVIYNAMKAAMISHAKNMALQLAPDNIRFNSVAPGSIMFPGGSWWRRREQDPEGWEQVRRSIAMGRYGTDEEVANVVVFLASPRASWVTGTCINVDGGQTKSNI